MKNKCDLVFLGSLVGSLIVADLVDMLFDFVARRVNLLVNCLDALGRFD